MNNEALEQANVLVISRDTQIIVNSFGLVSLNDRSSGFSCLAFRICKILEVLTWGFHDPI